MPVHVTRSRPAFGAAEDDHGPARPESLGSQPRLLLRLADLQDTVLKGGGHRLVHALRITALYQIRRVPVTDEQSLQLFMADAREDRGIVDLVPVKVQDGQHRPVSDRVEELVAVP